MKTSEIQIGKTYSNPNAYQNRRVVEIGVCPGYENAGGTIGVKYIRDHTAFQAWCTLAAFARWAKKCLD